MKEGLAAKAKAEILCKEPMNDCCERAFLSSIIHTAGSLLIGSGGRLGVAIRSTNLFLKDRLDKSLRQLYGIISVAEGGELQLGIDNALDVLLDLGILKRGEGLKINGGIAAEIVSNPCCKSRYVGGAFVGSGSLSATKSGYHLEFAFEGEEMKADFSALLMEFGIEGKYIARKNKHIIYLKNNELIGDCLALCGTGTTTLSISEMFVDRWQRRETNRQLNCDLANMERTINVGLRQAELFLGIVGDLTDNRLKNTALARIDHPEASYEELAHMLGVSKSGIKHRLKKLEELSLGRDFSGEEDREER